MAVLDNVKVMLGITDTIEDAKLNIIIKNTQQRLKTFLPATMSSIPEELDYIVEEVTIKRYNRIGSEGMSSESIEGRSSTYQLNDFDEYLGVLSAYNPQSVDDKAGSIKFYI